MTQLIQTWTIFLNRPNEREQDQAERKTRTRAKRGGLSRKASLSGLETLRPFFFSFFPFLEFKVDLPGLPDQWVQRTVEDVCYKNHTLHWSSCRLNTTTKEYLSTRYKSRNTLQKPVKTGTTDPSASNASLTKMVKLKMRACTSPHASLPLTHLISKLT